MSQSQQLPEEPQLQQEQPQAQTPQIQIMQSQQTSQVSQAQSFNNPKSDLQSYCQRYFGGKLPMYEGNKVTLPDGRVFEADFYGNKKEMEKRAALIALNAISKK